MPTEKHLVLKLRTVAVVLLVALFGIGFVAKPSVQHTAVNVRSIAPEVCEHNGTVKSAWHDQSEIHVTCSSGIVQLVAR